MPPGWVIYLAGALISAGGLAIGGFVIYLGTQVEKISDKTELASPSRPDLPVLSPQQEKLILVLYQTQVRFGARKLTVNRKSGQIFYQPNGKNQDTGVNLVQELFGESEENESRSREVEALVEDFPDTYLERMGESKWGNPFTLRLTTKGIEHAKMLPSGADGHHTPPPVTSAVMVDSEDLEEPDPNGDHDAILRYLALVDEQTGPMNSDSMAYAHTSEGIKESLDEDLGDIRLNTVKVLLDKLEKWGFVEEGPETWCGDYWNITSPGRAYVEKRRLLE